MSKNKPWIVSPAWDGLWMFAPFWGCLLFFVAIQVLGLAQAVLYFFAINLYVAVVHSWGPIFTILGNDALKEDRKKSPETYYLIPLIIVLLSLALGYSVAFGQILPKHQEISLQQSIFLFYLIIYWVGHYWHFGRQSFGVLSLYRRQASQAAPLERKADNYYCNFMYYVVQPILFITVLSRETVSQIVHTFVPVARETAVLIAEVVIVLALVATVAIITYEFFKKQRSLPKIAYYVLLLASPSLLFLSHHYPNALYYYVITYLWGHWFVAVGLTGRINVGTIKASTDHKWRTAMKYVLPLAAILTFSVIFVAKYGVLSMFNGGNYKTLLAHEFNLNLYLVGFLYSYFLGEQLLHYYADRVLYRFRNPAQRKLLPFITS